MLASSIIALTLIGMNFAASAGPNPPAAQDKMDVIVKFEDHSARDASIIEKNGGKVTGGNDVELVPVQFATIPEQAIEGIENNPKVETVEKDAEAEALSQTEPYGVTTQTNALETSNSVDESVVDVAVLDTGVDHDHPDLDENVEWCVRTVGAGIVRGDCSAADDGDGHGTHVSGTVAAENDSKGVVGAAPETDLYGIKVLDNSGSGSYSDIIEGIDEAVKGPDGDLGTDDDAEVISMSLGGPDDVSALEDAVNNAYSEGSMVVAAAGNDGNGNANTNEVNYPAKYSNAIAVAATDRNEETPRWSSEGKEVEVAAHGVSVYSTYKDGSYEFLSGTSMATPLVSGNIALMMAKDLSDGSRDVTNDEFRKHMQESAYDIEKKGFDKYSGYGVVNATAMAQIETKTGEKPSVNVTNPSEGEEVSGTVSLEAEASDSDASVDNVEFAVDGETVGTDSNKSDGWSLTWDSSTFSDGQYNVEATATDTQGLSSSDTVSFSTENEDNRPSASWNNPVDGEAVGQITEIRIEASDDRGVSGVRWQVDSGTWRNATDADDDGVYNASWDTKGYSDGSHDLTAEVTDTGGNTDTSIITVEVDNNNPPTVSWQNPVEGDTVNGKVDLRVAADDADGAVSEVEWRLASGSYQLLNDSNGDGVYEGLWNTSKISDGDYRLETRATDDDGETSTESVSVTLNNEQKTEKPPVISSFNVSEAGSPNPHLEVTADWTVTDENGNLADVLVELIDSAGKTVDKSLTDVNGGSASGTDKFKVKQVDGQTFSVNITVSDTAEKEDSDSKEVTE